VQRRPTRPSDTPSAGSLLREWRAVPRRAAFGSIPSSSATAVPPSRSITTSMRTACRARSPRRRDRASRGCGSRPDPRPAGSPQRERAPRNGVAWQTIRAGSPAVRSHRSSSRQRERAQGSRRRVPPGGRQGRTQWISCSWVRRPGIPREEPPGTNELTRRATSAAPARIPRGWALVRWRGHRTDRTSRRSAQAPIGWYAIKTRSPLAKPVRNFSCQLPISAGYFFS